MQEEMDCKAKPAIDTKPTGRPTTMHKLQLQALKTELAAAEATVAELKRLINDLEAG